ncbi:PREDICTED: testis-expressed sequence 36 protein [Chaetura pelagica]|uniref:testis-expressed sequence 36 protein n=1 Tax=Chaetura pelagica TaxID=8897 RepID=UPI000523D112|nr:PREDICTED: testis-expressed sequence 36 protein [Chaetura pelagica]
MAKGRRAKPSDRSAGIWFAHIGVHQSRLESITSSALKQIHDSGEAQYLENQLPLGYRARAQKAVNNNFPFSSHDNRHSLENVGEYFDSGLGRRKVEPERRQHNSQNFFLEAHELVPNSKDGLTTYQTSYVKHENTESTFWRRYPKQHKKWCTDKPAPETGKKPAAK